MIYPKQIFVTFSLALMALFAGGGNAQLRSPGVPIRSAALLAPQSRSHSMGGSRAIRITGVEVGVVILEQAATTTMDIEIQNSSGSMQQAELLVPVPEGAVVKKLSFQGNASEPQVQVLQKDEARRTYDSIVRRIKDPALLEFAGLNLIRTSVFPVGAGAAQKVRLTYEHILEAQGNRLDYVLPRTESVDYRVPWVISVKVKSRRPINTIYSPSHEIERVRRNENIISARLAPGASTEPGPFRLSCLVSGDSVSATFYSYPDPSSGGGYFLLLAGTPAKINDSQKGTIIKREVTLVLDRSGSMGGEKMDQAREAALQVIEGIEDGEAFRIIVYSDSVEVFSSKALIKSPETMEAAKKYLKSIRPVGGTNISDALIEALGPEPPDDMLPIVLFLTDGIPTLGVTSEREIGKIAERVNMHNRRVFTFGVGTDVNAPLLDNIAEKSRAMSTYVLPGEDVEVKVGGVFKRLYGPVLASPELRVIDGKGEEQAGRVQDLLPNKLPDIFEDDQLVILGRYVGGGPLRFEISGDHLGKRRSFRFDLDLDNATTRNSFVPRLWASRRIGTLVEQIRQSGNSAGNYATATADPRTRELVSEVVRLSKEFGILTEYTSFLATEGTDLSEHDKVLAQATQNFSDRAIRTRSGSAAVNQSFNLGFMAEQKVMNTRNLYIDSNLQRVTITNVQQVNDLSFFNRGGQWVDSRVIDDRAGMSGARTVEFGTDEFREIIEKLSGENRQGVLMLRGDVLLEVDGERVLIKAPQGK